MFVGVIGASRCDEELYRIAERVGELLAERGCVIVNGGLGGVMEASAKGAKKKNGLTVGILPGGSRREANPYIDIAIATNMGHARNVIIAHTCDALIAVGGEYGTLSEIAIALKLGKKVVAIRPNFNVKGMTVVRTPEEAVEEVLKERF